mmetsp:Transcript_15069/g.13222  ORF Transcript_15069/g.13222 Transcript_15069/m.13222 type:complete len:141 (-) Transcript_15069:520-942(-)
MITPYNNTLSLNKHMEFSSDSESEDDQGKKKDFNEKKWQFLSNILIKEKKDFLNFITESVNKVNHKPEKEKEEVTFSNMSKIAHERKAFNFMFPRELLETNEDDSPINDAQRQNLISQITRNFIIDELPEILKNTKKNAK